jgi:hypothetical protein
MTKALLALAVVGVVIAVVMLLTNRDARADRCGPALEQISALPAGWTHKRTRAAVTQGSPRHRAQDVVAPVGAEALLIGKFAYGKLDKDLKREPVRVLVQSDVPCGPWLQLGDVITSREGEHGKRHHVADDGGRIFVTLGAEIGARAGQHALRMVVLGDHSRAEASLFRVQPGTQTVLFDIDGTLTIDDKQITNQLLDKLLSDDYVPKMWVDAPAVARAWADKGYFIAYVTGRPDNLKRLTRQWLVDHGFPPGPLRLADGLRQVVPGSGGVGAYKTEHFRRLIRDAGLRVVAAYGNAETDITAYRAIGIPSERLFIIGPNAGKSGSTALRSYTEHQAFVNSAPIATTPAPIGFSW